MEALESRLKCDLDIQSAPDLNLGEFTLADNADLILDLCHQITPYEDLMDYKAFQKLLLSHNEKPKAPDKNDPVFDPHGVTSVSYTHLTLPTKA